MGLREAELRRELDACLCTHQELLPNSATLEDPFAPWPPISEFLHEEEVEESDDGEADVDEYAESNEGDGSCPMRA
jgi:hypothetical protein